MKLVTILMLALCVHLSATNADAQLVTLHEQNSELGQVFLKIRKQTGYNFLFNNQVLVDAQPVTVTFERMPLPKALDAIFDEQPLTYSIIERTIVIKEAPEKIKSLSNVPLTPLEEYTFIEDPDDLLAVIRGAVSDEAGEPLIGVNIQVKGTNRGTTTDFDGLFQVEADLQDTLVFSYVGYSRVEVPVNGRADINVTLVEDVAELEELVVVGYGTQKKENLTGSVSTVVVDDLKKGMNSNTTAALQGRVAGLRIVQGTGIPGRENVNIQLRGASSWGTNTTPLILVDGVVGSLDGIPVSDIESISVLKDAASASIYGSRAANGVILVSTKQGKLGKPTISYKMTLGSQSPTGIPDQLWDSDLYMELFNKAVARNTISAVPFPQSLIDKYKNPARDMELFPDFNWADAVWNSALIQEYNLGISGGTENTKYNVSAGFLDQNGVLIGHGYKRFNGLANISTNVNKYISAGTNISYLKGFSISPSFENEQFVLMSMTNVPMVKPYLPDGSGRYSDKVMPQSIGGMRNNRNPFWIASDTHLDKEQWRANIQGWVNVNFLHNENMNLEWSTKYAVNFSELFQQLYKYTPDIGAPSYYYLPEKEYNPGGSDEHFHGTMSGVGNQLGNNNYRTILNTLFSTLTWGLELNDHDITAMVGYSQESQNYRWLTGQRSIFPVKNMYELDGMGTSDQSTNGGHTEWAFKSLFGRATYAYRSKYLFEANFRYDGTSRIYKDNRWGFFPSASSAWRIGEEGFIKDNLPWLDNLKIRASYGLLGNANIGDYPWQDTYTTTSYAFNGNLEQGILQRSFKNRFIEWEKTNITDIGVDFNVNNDIIYGTIDWYNKYTTGILAGASVPSSAGMTAPTVNYGEFKNHGLEIELGHRNSIGGIKYEIYTQFSVNRNVVIKYPEPVYGSRIIEEGHPYNDYYLYENIGLFKSQDELDEVVTPGNPQLGDIKFKDQNNDGKIDGDDRIRVNGAYPDFIYSFGSNISWKNFDFSMFFQGVEGQKVKTNFFGEDPFSQGSSPNPKFLDAYDPVNNPGSNIPSIYGFGYAPMTGGTARNSTYFLKDASYLRLKNIEIGYFLPVSLVQRIGIGVLKVFVSSNNLLTFTDYPDLDPERAQDGWHAQYPQLKTISAGVNIKF